MINVRVAYNTVSAIFPELLAQHDPDFVLHIGMAGGRDCYSLETRAHRDGYRIKDVDDCDGFSCGELVWKREGVPDCLLVRWDEDDVLRRWEQGVEKGLVERGFLTNGPTPASTIPLPKGFTGPIKTVWGTVGATPVSRAELNRKKAVVKLSRDAGRFLCEFSLFESLSRRWLDAMHYKRPAADAPPHSPISKSSTTQPQRNSPSHEIPPSSSSRPASPASASNEHEHETNHRRDLALDRLGKVAFLHVPGLTGVEDINLGAMIAEEVIRALVGSWEDGFRRDRKAKIALQLSSESPSLKDDGRKYTNQNSEVDTGTGIGGGQATVAVVGGQVTLVNGVGVGIEDLEKVKWRS